MRQKKLDGRLERIELLVNALRLNVPTIADDDRAASQSGRARVKRLAFAAAAFVLAGFSVTVLGLAGFSDPVPSDEGRGTVQLLLSAESGSSELQKYEGAKLSVSYSPEIGEDASYFFYVPRALVGRKFAIVADRTAVLDRDVEANFPIEHEFRSSECPWDETQPEFGDPRPRPCQVIGGSVPSRTNYEFDECNPLIYDGREYVLLWLRGHGTYEKRLDWAHRQIDMPRMSGAYSEYTIQTWSGQGLGGPFGTLVADSCSAVLLRNNDSVAAAGPYDNPSEARSFNRIKWPKDSGDSGATFTTKSNYTPAVTNFVVAFGAAVAAVGIGFIPVVYENLEKTRSNTIGQSPRRKNYGRI